MADHDELLKSLHAHGEQFMQQFSLSSSQLQANEVVESSDESEEDQEEWGGIISDAAESGEGEGWDTEEDEPEVSGSSTANHNVIVFNEPRPSENSNFSREGMREFMSSKISRIKQQTDSTEKKDPVKQAEADEEKTNAQNDAMLHKLVHTKLLSGSLDRDLDLTPAQRRKALAGRVLELAGEVKLGKGEFSLTKAEHTQASKRVREGISEKRRERQKQQLEEAKNIGNYHPRLKKLFEDETSSASRKNRPRGLKMGVGNFKGGVLTLTKADIEKVSGRGPRRGSYPYKRK